MSRSSLHAADRGPSRGPLRFGPFEVSFAARELRKGGVRVHLQQQPFQVLDALLARPGETVAYEELIARIWPNETHGEFVRNLRQSVRRLRAALGDSPTNPRWIVTVPKVGYRFIGPLTAAAPGARPALPPRARYWAVAALLVIGVAAALVVALAARDAQGSATAPDAPSRLGHLLRD